MEVRKHNGILVGVVRVNVSLFHVSNVLLIVTLSILSLIGCLLSREKKRLQGEIYFFLGEFLAASLFLINASSNLDFTLKATDENALIYEEGARSLLR